MTPAGTDTREGLISHSICYNENIAYKRIFSQYNQLVLVYSALCKCIRTVYPPAWLLPRI